MAVAPMVSAIAVLVTAPAHMAGATTTTAGNAIVTDSTCNANEFPANDDGYTGPVSVGATFDFFGTQFNSVYVDNNGNVAIGQGLSQYTPSPIISEQVPLIAPLWADVDTRGAASNTTHWGTTTFGGRPAFCANWIGVGYYSEATDKLDNFQLLLVDRSDVGPGDFDIVFNYGSIQWETGGASGGTDGLGGYSARVGYTNGSTTSLELPGSGVPGSFIDGGPDALDAHSANSDVPGRYVFPVRNGNAPLGGSIGGQITEQATGNPVPDAGITLCSSGGACNSSYTDGSGHYSIVGLGAGDYTLTAFPPYGSNLNQGSMTLAGFAGTGIGTLNLALGGPQPPAPGVTVNSNTGYSGGSAVPTVYWGAPWSVTYQACVGGNGTWALTAVNEQTGQPQLLQGPMTEGPPGTYTANIPAVEPLHGAAHVNLTVVCPDSTTENSGFDVYIDPSGLVVDQHGHPVAGATVTLFRSQAGSSGPYAAVANHDQTIMSPANSSNPQVTPANGEFGWDVTPGYYQVAASAPNCSSTTSPVLTIPPPVTGLQLVLDCTYVNTITITSHPPTVAATGETGVGQTYPVVATASSGLPVLIGIDAASTVGVCIVSGSTVTFQAPGTCVIDATQAGNGAYQPATMVQQSVVVHSVAQLTTSLQAPTTVAPGGLVTYTLKVANSGPGTATNVNATLFLPTGVTLVGESGAPTGASNSGVQWRINGLTAGSAATFSVTVRVNTGTTGHLSAYGWAYPYPNGSIDPSAVNAGAVKTTLVMGSI